MGKSNYRDVMTFFDADPKTGLAEFCFDLIEEDEPGQNKMVDHFLESEEGKLLSVKIADAIGRQRGDCLWAGFAVGYALGREFDISDQETLEIVNELRDRIFEEKALPYFPARREKKRRSFPSPEKEKQGVVEQA